MPFPVLGSNSAVAGFEIDNSLRFNDDDNAFLSRTPSSSGSRTIATVSFWVKRGNLKASGDHFMLEASSSTSPFNMTRVRFSNDLLVIDNTLNGSAANGFMFQSNREYRDPSAFYHIFFSIDVTQANATDGWLLYVNGVQQTKALSFWTQNANLEFSQSSVQMNIGRRHDNTNDNLDGCLAEYHYIDGTRKLYTDFGEFNDNGVWIPKEYDGGSYGTNGFFLEFQDSGNLGDDTSGNGNDFTPTNLTATDQTTDTPTNNWCTFNPLTATGGTYSEGNTVITTGSNASRNERGTFGMDNGKWYWEYKLTGSSIDNIYLGIGTTDTSIGSEQTGTYTYYSSGSTGRIYTGGSIVATPTAFAVGDIVSIGYNADDNQVLFYLNGSLVHTTSSVTDITYNPFARIFYTTSQVEANFGNPPFTISSGNSDGAGFGNFEYAVPSGYYALCTKNLAEYG